MASSRRQYPFHLIEPKWQQTWAQQQTFRAWNPGESVPAQHPFAQRHGAEAMADGRQAPPKFYILDMFPYPSGAGLHVGHPEGYTATDILARYRRAQGFNVLHPMGWDSFGLPAEQYAVKTGQHPRKTTEANIANFTRQIKSLGFSYDWSREVATTDVEYFKWTQWIFLKLYNSWLNPETNQAEPIETLKYPENLQLPEERVGRVTPCAPSPVATEPCAQSDAPRQTNIESARRSFRDSKRLAYVSEAPVNWCPELGTVLANEEVIDGKSEVGGYPVIRKPMRQWMLRITAYAEKLLTDLDTIDWSDSLKEMQRNWIGRSEGAEVDFQIDGSAEKIRVFTTRPDTLFGATYMVLSPEHKLLEKIVPQEWPTSTPYYWKGPGSEVIGVIRESGEKHVANWEKVRVPSSEITLQKSSGFGAEIVSIKDWKPVAGLPEEIQRRISHYHAVVLDATPNRIVVAVSGPADLTALDAIAHLANREVDVKVAAESDIEVAIRGNWGTYWSPKDAVESYQAFAAGKSDLERTELAKEKTGVFTGAYAINPVNGQKIPIWIADYVLATYGTGAIMAVPAHDTRDFEFAQKFNLPVIQVVQPGDPKTPWQGFTDDGTSVNSGFLTGLPTSEAKTKIADWLKEKGLGQKTINYKLRDWLFSRQRYWGEPFPIVWKKDAAGKLQHEALPESALPVLPPTLEDYKPTADGQPPLARATEWLTLPDGSTRETNTMPQWAGSCWYYLRYLDAKNNQAFVGKDAESYWMGCAANPKSEIRNPKATTPGVDLYVGGTEHAVLHLLYARFWHKILFDLGYVSTPEPFFKLVNQGLILGEMEFTAFVFADGKACSASELKDISEEATSSGKRMVGIHKQTGEVIGGKRISETEVEKTSAGFALKTDKSILVDARTFKMSKARGNVVNPDDVVHEFGADSLRLYEMFMGPLQEVKPWNTQGVAGVYKFLGRVWRLFVDDKSETTFELAETTAAEGQHRELLDLILLDGTITDVEATPAQLKTLHACIKKVTEDLDGMRFNTAISAMMVFVNEAMTWQAKPLSVLKPFLQLLAPFAPHLAEELWARLHSTFGQVAPSLTYSAWPKFDPALLVENEIEIPVQVNGKFRDVIKVAATADNATLEAAARAAEKVQVFIAGKTIKKVIVVPKKMVNLIVG